jgi:hypothetical protein
MLQEKVYELCLCFLFIIVNKDATKLNKRLSSFYSVAYSFVSLHIPED